MPESGVRRRAGGIECPPRHTGLSGGKDEATLTCIEDAPAPHRFNKFVIKGYRKGVRRYMFSSIWAPLRRAM